MARPWLWLCTVAACGGGLAPEKMTSPQDVAPRNPNTIEEAQLQLQQAQADLDVTGNAAAPPQPPPVEQHEPTMSGGGASPSSRMESDCSRLCRAFASMQRAQAAICRLAGEEDPRCADAKKTVADNAQRVAKCGCST